MSDNYKHSTLVCAHEGSLRVFRNGINLGRIENDQFIKEESTSQDVIQSAWFSLHAAETAIRTAIEQDMSQQLSSEGL